MFMKRGYTDFVFDVADVLVTWPKDLTCPIDRKALRSCLVSRTWYQYESGRLSKTECFERLSSQFKLDASTIDAAWAHVCAQLRPNADMVALVGELRSARPGVRVVGVLNTSAPDDALFRAKASVEWALFDAVYTSHELGIRLPNPGFFERMLAPDAGAAQFDPLEAVFVGHDADDVVTARAYGMHGVLLSDFAAARRELRNLVGDPVKRGWEYLRANAGKLACDADRPGVSIMENFGQLLILEATGDR